MKHILCLTDGGTRWCYVRENEDGTYTQEWGHAQPRLSRSAARCGKVINIAPRGLTDKQVALRAGVKASTFRKHVKPQLKCHGYSIVDHLWVPPTR